MFLGSPALQLRIYHSNVDFVVAKNLPLAKGSSENRLSHSRRSLSFANAFCSACSCAAAP